MQEKAKSCTFFVIMETLSVGNFISKLYNCHKELKGDKGYNEANNTLTNERKGIF